MKELLPILPRPSRYIGSEWGTVFKDLDTVTVRCALAFPDMYEVGMSYLGQKILARAINSQPQFWAERVFTPCEETAAIMREHKVPLATLESDTPLGDMDIIGFSLTHELCYTNVLYMLDLAGIPFRSTDRDDSHPLIMAGGGAAFNAEPMAPFFDAMVIGDGEEAMPQVLSVIEQAKKDNFSRAGLLEALAAVPGIYVPAFFEDQGPGKPLRALREGYETVEKAVVDDLNTAGFPTGQVIPFGAIHDRLTMEIARGCTRGCRFCQAGMIYRPVRERSLDELDRILTEGLAQTGYEETSMLSLSTGDFSGLDTLFTRSFDKCAAEQISISLPSLRVGSLSSPIMERISSIRRTGATLAPEAGSQRLRDVINKGVDEQGLIDHVRLLFDNGWQGVKLYFMIGLPTETDEDLDAIVDLCLKVRDSAGRHIKRLQVTAAVSPFVPKPQTPFQWEPQISFDEIYRRISYLRDKFRPHKRISIKYHEPEMTSLEGVFSRGDRRLAEVVERAYAKGALFSSWKDHLRLAPYKEAMDEAGLNWDAYTGPRNPEGPLPWDHLSCGLTKKFLLRERERALSGKITEDCRYGACRNCGVCEFDGKVSTLSRQSKDKDIRPKLVFQQRDQEGEQPAYSVETPDLTVKAAHYRLWFEKTGPAAYLSQLELQAVFERAFRRAGLPMAFSAGFHPMPRLSFGMALPVGVESRAEWINIFLRKDFEPAEVVRRLLVNMPIGLAPLKADRLDMGRKQPQSVEEIFELRFLREAELHLEQWRSFMVKDKFIIEKRTKKRGMQPMDIRPLVTEMVEIENGLTLVLDWRSQYMSPLSLCLAVMDGASQLDFALVKTAQRFA
ncbi:MULTISPECIES: TIGR03960 family B12-binding radical SAM protein [unclassified Pseudodesulfovibrio]|uniref:TIGR03960 family B12-binding radical SAM protein n=1 Tax=unclassified Pseudodesulfovibrio TaxID=2661612 RepID=UPI000FEBA042|nr:MULTISPECIES: TIGR03960 family B12-binding radical SAM protein [unclassified Pseudodesulfovibrio]MCJ2164178.1 TIGR03960 family B12-binding radical SAM protein [Pseudodesulfovibrio sp. S3-i]RWU05196.1 TIGR03960 family B12-binding radical SAM protein [Pseudodesulfovibrio sp. S3]